MPYKLHDELLHLLESLLDSAIDKPVLDLACGTGRSGLYLAEKGFPVVFADRSGSALHSVNQILLDRKLPGHTWQVDLEQAGINPMDKQVFSAVVCFRYLHRPLFPFLMKAVEPGGMIVYETFTTGNRQFGRPNNPDFLLRPGELRKLFQNWQILHSYEGIQHGPDRAIAQIAARKPVI